MPDVQHLIDDIDAYVVVMSHALEHGEFALLLADHERFAACKTRPQSKTACAPNYASGEPHGLLSAPLNTEGLTDMLDWTTREDAVLRFRRLAGLPTASTTFTRVI